MSKTTLAQVAAMADDTWINDPVQCVVNITKQGVSKTSQKPYWQAELTDPDDPSCPVVSTVFMSDPSRYNGKLVSIEGKGSTKGSFKDKPQFNIGFKAYLKVVGDAGPAAAPAPQTTRPQAAPTATAPARTTPTNTVNGQSIGMAVKEAHLSILKSGQPLTEDAIVALAGIFLRASSRLEHGEHMQQAAQPVKRPQPGPNGAVDTSGVEEDVPW